MLKKVSDQISLASAVLFNKCFKSGILLSDWKITNKVPAVFIRRVKSTAGKSLNLPGG